MSDIVAIGDGKFRRKKTRADGSLYEGELEKSAAMGYIPHGQGKWSHPDGDTYSYAILLKWRSSECHSSISQRDNL